MVVIRTTKDPVDQFYLRMTGLQSVEEVQDDIWKSGSDHEPVVFIELDLEDAGIVALMGIMDLATAAAGGVEYENGIERLLVTLFMAGRNSRDLDPPPPVIQPIIN